MEGSVLKPSDRDNQLLTPNSLKDSWDAIRVLDEEENWAERNRVLSRSDHEQLVKCAKEIIYDLVQELPIDSISPQSASYSTEELTDEDFNYSTAQFDVDYLERISSEGDPQTSALTRESLYVKFDPLVSKASPRKGAKKRTPKRPQEDTSSDLLQFNTPPPVSSSSDVTNRVPHEPSTPSGLLNTSHRSTASSANSTLTPQPHQRSQVSNSNDDESATLCIDMVREETDASEHTPKTDCLVKVLKYSEDDLTQLLEEARTRGREMEKENLDREVADLQKKIRDVKRQMKPQQNKNHKIEQIVVTYESKRDKIQHGMEEYSETLLSHSKRQQERLEQHVEYKSHEKQSKKYYELVSKGTSVLENKFDELHSRHVDLKAVHKKVSQAVQSMEKYCDQLKEDNKDVSERWTHLQAELQARMEEVSQKVQRLKKEHASKMSIEKTKTMKFQLQVESLETSLQQMEQDKQQLSQLCEELMEQLEAKNA